MAIKEKDLETIESLSEGDKIRVVTSEGNSRNVDASQIGGSGNLILTETVEEIQTRAVGRQYLHTLSATYNEMMDVIQNGGSIKVVSESTESGVIYIDSMDIVQNNFSPFHVIDAEESNYANVGYYLPYVFTMGTPYEFYSATPDGAMTFIGGEVK